MATLKDIRREWLENALSSMLFFGPHDLRVKYASQLAVGAGEGYKGFYATFIDEAFRGYSPANAYIASPRTVKLLEVASDSVVKGLPFGQWRCVTMLWCIGRHYLHAAVDVAYDGYWYVTGISVMTD